MLNNKPHPPLRLTTAQLRRLPACNSEQAPSRALPLQVSKLPTTSPRDSDYAPLQRKYILPYVRESSEREEPKSCESEPVEAILKPEESCHFFTDKEFEEGAASKSYIPKSCVISKAQRSYLWDLLAFIEDSDARRSCLFFVAHILVSKEKAIDEFWKEERPGVYIHSKAIEGNEKTWRVRADVVRLLHEHNVLAPLGGPSYSVGRYTLRYAVAESVAQEFYSLGISSPHPTVDAFTGKARSYKKPRKQVLTNGHDPYSELLQAALQILTADPIPMNVRAAEGHVEALLAKAKATGDRGDRARFEHDARCLMKIKGAIPPEMSGDIVHVPLRYFVVSTGRVFVEGAMSQGCSRAMKQALFGDVPAIHNYDLKSCHPRLLLQEFEKAGIQCGWLRDFLDSNNVAYAARLEMPVKCFKAGLLAVMYGAGVPSPGEASEQLQAIFAGGKNSCPDLLKEIFARYHNSALEAATAYDRFHAELQEFLTCRAQWYNSLRSTWIPANKSRGVVYNAAGMPFRLSGALHKLASHLLQGLEAAFMHYLTIESQNHYYRVIQNEHDGLVTIGHIPTSAVSHAARQAGVEGYALLTEKPFMA